MTPELTIVLIVALVALATAAVAVVIAEAESCERRRLERRVEELERRIDGSKPEAPHWWNTWTRSPKA